MSPPRRLLTRLQPMPRPTRVHFRDATIRRANMRLSAVPRITRASMSTTRTMVCFFSLDPWLLPCLTMKTFRPPPPFCIFRSLTPVMPQLHGTPTGSTRRSNSPRQASSLFASTTSMEQRASSRTATSLTKPTLLHTVFSHSKWRAAT